jgi:hypothetical protein
MREVLGWFNNIALADPALWLALAAFLAVLLFFVVMGRRKSIHMQAMSGSNSEAGMTPATNWNNTFKRLDEKRRSVRRGGVPTPLWVMDPLQPKRPVDAYVLDRSSGGVRIAIQKPLSVGVNMQVRPQNATQDTPWIPVMIRSCKEVGDYYEIGCQFDKELPWNLLLLFG